MPYQLGETPIYNSMKYLNLIAYIPGLAGRFTQILTSLHPTTALHMNSEASITDVSVDRARQYSYKDLYSRYGSWRNHHMLFCTTLDNHDLDKFLESNYSNMTYCVHPTVFYLQKFTRRAANTLQPGTPQQILQSRIQKENLQIRYLQISLSEEYQPLVDEFKVRNSNFPAVGNEEKILNSKFVREYNPYIINLDNYFIRESNFLVEYTKLMNHLGIPTQDELALELYRDWIEARNSTPNFGAPSRNRTGMPESERF
jgi:hypothetical protein